MFHDNISQNIDILVVINVWKNDFGFHSNQKTQGQKHQVNNLYFKYQVCQIELRHLNTFLQFRLLFHEPHCISRIFSYIRFLMSRVFFSYSSCMCLALTTSSRSRLSLTFAFVDVDKLWRRECPPLETDRG